MVHTASRPVFLRRRELGVQLFTERTILQNIQPSCRHDFGKVESNSKRRLCACCLRELGMVWANRWVLYVEEENWVDAWNLVADISYASNPLVFL